EAKGCLCKSCARKKNLKENPDLLKALRNGFLKHKEENPEYNLGENNPFYGKKHSEESKRKIVENRDQSALKTEEFREKMKKINNARPNPMKGSSVYEIWIKKYGLEVANKKWEEFKRKQSENNSGKNNPMFGKPAPKKSGNGWKGWYHGHF